MKLAIAGAAVFAALALGCIAQPFETASDPDACPETTSDFPTYAYECSADGRTVLGCQLGGEPADCDKPGSARVHQCTCDSLTSCSASTRVVACVRGARPPSPEAGPT